MAFIKTLPVGRFQCNCTLIACERTREAVLIDPGDEADKLSALLTQHGFQLRWILHTHAHLDHFMATGAVKQRHGGTVCLHRQDRWLYEAAPMQASMLGLPMRQAPAIEHDIEDEQAFDFGDHATSAIFTPGHTPGSTSFLFRHGDAQILFAGDTLFQRSVGRTDLPGGDSGTLVKSIQQRLFTLDPETVVVPGHGPHTRIGEERQDNPFVGQRRRSF